MNEHRTPFVSKSLERAVTESFAKEVARHIREGQAAYLDPSNTLEFQHGRRWESPANALGEKTGEVKQHSFASELKLEDVVKGNPAIIFRQTQEVAKGMFDSFERMLFSKILAATEKTGNVVNAADHDSLLDAFVASIEKIEMSVDEKGELSLPTLALHPDQSQVLAQQFEAAPPELLERIERIKAMKLEDATRKEQERRNRFENQEE